MDKYINKIIEGDCLEVMPLLPDKSVDMILCDLPYGTTACSWDTIIPFEPLWKQYKRIIKDNGAIVLTASQPFTSALVMSNPKMFKHEWIWEKQKASNFLSMKYSPAKYHENVVVFSKGKPTFNPIKWQVDKSKIDRRKTRNSHFVKGESHVGNLIRTRYIDDGSRYPKSIIRIKKNTNGNLHPTEKPVELMAYLIKTYTNLGDLVLDNCIGSGTTAVACKNLGRKFIGIELDSQYIKIANNRLAQEVLF
jgi:site-specific DNA-methyltransferase (adenine-specific)